MTRSLFGGRLYSAGVTFALVILATAVAVDFDGSSYARNASLDADMDIFWTINTDLDTVLVAVHAKAASGWAGFGVSEMGGMEGADIVFYELSVSQAKYSLLGLDTNELYCCYLHVYSSCPPPDTHITPRNTDMTLRTVLQYVPSMVVYSVHHKRPLNGRKTG